MKQITQKELVEFIKDKQKNARLDMERKSQTPKDIMEYVQSAKLAGNFEAYQDLICYINSIEIIPDRIEANKGYFVGGNYPEEQIVTTIPKAKQEEIGLTQEDLKKMIENTPITPYNEPKMEKLRYDRFKEFFFDNGARRIIDAKAVKTISLEASYQKAGYDVYVDTIIMKKAKPYDVCKDCYENLVEWWKYWKQN